jgi:hypothetical protein
VLDRAASYNADPDKPVWIERIHTEDLDDVTDRMRVVYERERPDRG